MGSIESNGRQTFLPVHLPDLYCYLCDDSVLDPKLAEHLHVFGIDVGTQQKTEKSMAELVSPLQMAFPRSPPDRA